MRDFGVRWTTTQESEERQFRVQLTSSRGQVYLYTQICMGHKSCGFKSDEVVTNKQVATGHNMTFDESLNPTKSISITVKCDKNSAVSTSTISETMNELTCMLNVGVYGKEADSSKAEYTLLIQDISSHLLVQANSWQKYRIESNRPLLLQFNLQRRQYNDIDHLLFRFDMHYGQATAYVSKRNRNPCNGEELLEGALSLQANSPSQILITSSMMPNMRGIYYICVIAKELTSVSVDVEPVVTSFKDGQLDHERINVPALPAHEQLLGEISNKTHILYFSFSASVDPKGGEYIQVHLFPIKGVFRVFASNNEKLPVSSQSYWNVVGNTLTIKSNDPGFKQHAVYLVGVMIAPSSTLSVGSKAKFLVSYSLSDSHATLRPSMPVLGDTTSSKRNRYFQLEIPRTANNLTLIKTSLEGSLALYASTNSSQGYPSSSSAQFLVTSMFSGLFIDRNSISHHCSSTPLASPCTLFITVEAYAPTHFSLQFVIDSGYFTLAQSFPTQIPILEDPNAPLHFLFHNSGTKDIEFELRPLYQSLHYMINWAPDKGDSLQYIFPVKGQNTTYVVEGDTDNSHDAILVRGNNTVDGIVLVTIQSQVGNSLGAQAEKLSFYNNGYLEVSTEDKTLQPGIPVLRDVGYGEWKYLRLRHSQSTSVVLSVEMQEGFAEVFVSKGNQALPSEKNFIFHRYDSRDDVITIDQNSLPFGEPLTGDYLIGIKGISLKTLCTLVYQTGNLQVLVLPVGIPTTYRIGSTGNVYIELNSDGQVEDLDVTFQTTLASLKVYAIARGRDLKVGEDQWPTPEKYVWNATLNTRGGIGKLRMSKTNPAFCTYCQIVLLVQASVPDRVEFLARKSGMYSKIRLIEGKQYISTLKANESDSYVMIIPYNESQFALDLRAQKGGVVLIYSLDPTFTNPNMMYTIPMKGTEESFSINFSQLGMAFRNFFKSTTYRFIKITALANETHYTLGIVSNNMLTPLTPQVLRTSILSKDGRHIYYTPTHEGEELDLSLHLLSLVDMQNPKFDAVMDYLPRLVKAYYCASFKQVVARSYDYEAQLQVSLFHHEVRLILDKKDVKNGYLVYVVENNIGKSLSYSLTLSTSGVKVLPPNHESAETISNGDYRYFVIDQLPVNSIARVRMDQCLGGIEAQYAYSELSAAANSTDLQWQTLLDSQVNNGFLRAKENKQIQIRVSKDSPNKEASVSSVFSRQYSRSIPSVFSIAFQAEIDGAADTGVNAGSLVVGDLNNYGEVEVHTDSGQTVQFQGLTFHPSFLEANKDMYLMVNYTLYMSKDREMLKFMKYCDYYRIDLAEQAIDTTNHYSFSQTEYYALNLHQNERVLRSTHSIEPTTLSFGGVYFGVIVAEVRLWRKTVKQS